MLLSTKMYCPHDKDECSKMRTMDIYLEEPQAWLEEAVCNLVSWGFGLGPCNFDLVDLMIKGLN